MAGGPFGRSFDCGSIFERRRKMYFSIKNAKSPTKPEVALSPTCAPTFEVPSWKSSGVRAQGPLPTFFFTNIDLPVGAPSMPVIDQMPLEIESSDE